MGVARQRAKGYSVWKGIQGEMRELPADPRGFPTIQVGQGQGLAQHNLTTVSQGIGCWGGKRMRGKA